MAFARKIDGAWIELSGLVGASGTCYPFGWPAEDLQSDGIFPITEPGERPSEVSVIGSTIVEQDGFPVRVWSTAPFALSEAKRIAWDKARAYREEQANGGCASPLGRVDTDADSQRKVNGAVTAAMAAQMLGMPFTPIPWTMEDDSIVLHDAPAIIAMGLAVIGHIQTCQANGNAIRAQIDAAETPEAAFAVDRTAGYPA